MSRSRIILRNIASNWTGFAVQAVVHFFLTPFILEQLGETRYGVWVLTITITGYYGLLAFGLTGGVTQYVTRYLAVRDFEKLNEAASTAFAILSGLGTLVLASSVALAALAPHVFNIPVENRDEVFWCILIVGVSVAAQFTLFLFSAVLVATQRYDLSNLVGISVTLLSAALTFLLLSQGYGIVGLCAANTASEIIGYLVRRKLAYRVLPELSLSRRLLSLAALRRLFSYGTWSFVIAIAQSIFSQIDALVIGAFMPMAAVSRYALAATVCTQMQSVLRPIDRVFFPTFTDLHARGDVAGMRSLYLRALRLYLIAVAITATIATFWATDFYRLWIGAKFVESGEYPSVPFIFYLLAIVVAGQLLPAMGGQILLATLNVRALAILAISEAIANALLSIWFVQIWGLAGVAMATVVTVLAIRTLGIPMLVRPIVGVSVPTYLLRVVVRPMLIALCLFPLIAAARRVAPPENFAMLILQGLVSLAAAAPLALFIGLNRDERESHIYPAIRRIVAASAKHAINNKDA